MYFRISNTATKEIMEETTNASFEYPNLYRPQIIINGLNEVTIPIITMEAQSEISFAIWGLLPEKYKEDWTVFQNISNTLNLHEAAMNSNLWYVDALKNRRSIVPVTGFFTSIIKNGASFPYYISLKSDKPFYLASIHNILEDGFITCSLLVGEPNVFIRNYQNTVDCMPILLSEDFKEDWLNKNTSLDRIKQILKTPTKEHLQANPIAKELFNKDISYDSLLLPYEYPHN
ncbi:SOS response-associated peptidase family protein [Maribacter sp. CXY002]|uniref:SOS response-associated peptidase family protein n=1 Tax=Maribacter luteocoastalis TaxID=3407671 RepID=UPI003B6783C9